MYHKCAGKEPVEGVHAKIIHKYVIHNLDEDIWPHISLYLHYHHVDGSGQSLSLMVEHIRQERVEESS